MKLSFGLLACVLAVGCSRGQREDRVTSSQQQVDTLLEALEREQPVGHDLGTPSISETENVRRLVAKGPQIVPYLAAQTRTRSAKVTAYIALTLRTIGGADALAALRELRDRYQSLPQKGEWEYAVIGQCNLALP